MSLSGYSELKANAGQIEVARSISIIMILDKQLGKPHKTNNKNGINSGMVVVIAYDIDFCKLSKINLPSAIPYTSKANESFIKTILAASRAISDPVAIATPTSAYLSAEASFNPSPVAATICPSF
jgi:hypothetical protein